MKMIFLFLLFLFSNLLHSQPYSRLSYICTTELRKGKVHDGRNVLYFDQEKSLFIHQDFPKEDRYIDKGTIFQYIKGDTEGLPVFINLKEKYLYYKSEYSAPPGEIFIFREELPVIDWKILPEEKTLGALHCIRAVGEFGGRTYYVWFTPDIPVSLGPYKLWGLPGLILEARSTDGRVQYVFDSYEPLTQDEVKVQKPQQGREMSWEAFKEHVINRLHQTEALPGNGTNNDPPADYEIERSKFTILSAYKKQREAGKKQN